MTELNKRIFTEDELRDLIVENQLTDEDIKQIIHNQNFKQAIDVLFGTVDLNELHSISQGVDQIKKYVDSIHKNTVHSKCSGDNS